MSVSHDHLVGASMSMTAASIALPLVPAGANRQTIRGSKISVVSDLHWGKAMKRVVLAVLLTAFATSGALAQSCTTTAVSKDGKPLAGAAKTSFIKHCCEQAAVSKDGKPLSGAAKTSFVTKCMKG
jgi:hypothetical protein